MIYLYIVVFWRDNGFKIIPVQNLTKFYGWSNNLSYVFIITYPLGAQQLYVLFSLIANYHPFVFIRFSVMCAYVIEGEEGTSWVNLRPVGQKSVEVQ